MTKPFLDALLLLIPLWDALDLMGVDVRQFVGGDDPWGIPADDEEGWCQAHLIFDHSGVLLAVV